MNEDRLVLKECPVCGVEYKADPVRLKHGRQTTCSRSCSYKLRTDKQRNAVSVNCAICNKSIDRPKCKLSVKNGLFFCSKSCLYEGRRTGVIKRDAPKTVNMSPENRKKASERMKAVVAKRVAAGACKHSPESRAKMSKSAIRAIQEGKVRRVSKLEDTVAGELDRQGVAYERQKIFRDSLGKFAFVLDFWLPSFGCALEVNGTYWHADPRVYSGELNSTQLHNAKFYQRKVEGLKQLGIPLREVWEMDIRHDLQKSVSDALLKTL